MNYMQLNDRILSWKFIYICVLHIQYTVVPSNIVEIFWYFNNGKNSTNKLVKDLLCKRYETFDKRFITFALEYTSVGKQPCGYK